MVIILYRPIGLYVSDLNGNPDLISSRAKDYISLQIGDRLISLTGNCGRLCVVCEENLLLNQRVGLLCCDAIYLEYFSISLIVVRCEQ